MATADSYRVMHTFNGVIPALLPVPSKWINSMAEHRPTHAVMYTAKGAFMARLHPGSVSNCYEIRTPDIEWLLVTLEMLEGNSMEFEAHGTTDIVVRAYQRDGRERNSREMLTHSRVRYRADITDDRQLRSLVIHRIFIL